MRSLSRRRFLPLLALAAFVFLTACGDETKKTEAAKTVDDRFPIKVGGQVVQMQLAVLSSEMQRGLMFRKAMGADEGMIFVYDQAQTMSFWMRDTLIPLDIGYFDGDGTLKEIYPMYPHDERPVASRGRRQFALEMNQGWYAHAGVKPGAMLDLKALSEALRARGFKPERFGLR